MHTTINFLLLWTKYNVPEQFLLWQNSVLDNSISLQHGILYGWAFCLKTNAFLIKYLQCSTSLGLKTFALERNKSLHVGHVH